MCSCCFAAVRYAAELIVVARYPFQAEAAKTIGANHVIRGSRDSDYYEGIVEHNGGRFKKSNNG